MYSGSGAALLLAAGWSVEPTARRQTNRCRPSPFKLRAWTSSPLFVGTNSGSGRQGRVMEKCWALPKVRRQIRGSKWRWKTRDPPTFICLPARADGGWARRQQHQSRSRMNSLMAVWRKYRRRRPNNCHGVIKFAVRPGKKIGKHKGKRSEWVFTL